MPSQSKISRADLLAAHTWITNKLRNPSFFEDDTDMCTAQEVKAIREWRAVDFNIDRLNDWCDQWLNDKKRCQLMNSIRQKRYRAANRGKVQRVDLSREAYSLLAYIARAEGKTLSETLIAHLEPVYR